MVMSRIKQTLKNVAFGIVGNLVTLALSFFLRTVFIYMLGTTYLGVNSLFTSVLSILSFSELGICVAMNYSLYKPVADNDRHKIKLLMSFYKKAYRVVALIITLMGLGIYPFLGVLTRTDLGDHNISIYYFIFLFNTVSTYFVSYKFSLVNVEQKSYIYTNINTIASAMITVAQIIVLCVYKNFLAYLLTNSLLGLLQKIYINHYLNRLYPYLKEESNEKLPKEDLGLIKKNVGALVWHKIGEMSVYQTDNIIISAFVNITTVGIISNYNLIMSSVTRMINIVLDAAIPSFGNLMTAASVEKKYELFKVYRFIAFWLYGFSALAFYFLLTPFVTLWIGIDNTISEVVVFLIVLNYYMVGHRVCINNIKIAGGIFSEDKYVSLMQAVVNLVVSILFVKLIGLPGVYIGTITQGTLSTIIRPIIVYKKAFNISSIEYFKDSIRYVVPLIISAAILFYVKKQILTVLNFGNFFILVSFVAVIPNTIILIFNYKRKEFKYLVKIILKGRRM